MPHWFTTALWIWIGSGVLIFPFLFFVRAPYGRHSRKGWGKTIDNHLGWFWMELPALLVFPLLAILGPSEKNGFTWLLIGMWTIHYTHRVLIFPFRIRTKNKKMPLSIAVSAMFFNLINGFFNGYWLGFLADDPRPFSTAICVIGVLLFFTGMAINMITDYKLIALRKQQSGYVIPKGWLFERISCPNHFGEITEWIGFAIAAWALPPLSFAIWTFVNLAPRAFNHHAWYKEQFSDYPRKRKALIPFIV